MNKNKYLSFIIIILSFLLSVFTYIVYNQLTTTTANKYKGEKVELYDDQDFVNMSGLIKLEESFVSTNSDPQIIFRDINYNVRLVEIVFNEPVASDIYGMFVFFAKSGQFNSENAISVDLTSAETHFFIEIPEGNWDSLRIDIEGKEGSEFSIKNINIMEKIAERTINLPLIASLFILFVALLLKCKFVNFLVEQSIRYEIILILVSLTGIHLGFERYTIYNIIYYMSIISLILIIVNFEIKVLLDRFSEWRENNVAK